MAQFFSTVIATPGTPQKLAGTTLPAQAAISGVLGGTVPPVGSVLVLTASAANTAAKKIFWGNSSMVVSTLSGIGGFLLPGIAITIPLGSALVDLGDFWIDTDSGNAATEKLFVTVI